MDGTYQSVRVTEGSSVVEIVRALSQRHNVPTEQCALFKLTRRERLRREREKNGKDGATDAASADISSDNNSGECAASSENMRQEKRAAVDNAKIDDDAPGKRDRNQLVEGRKSPVVHEDIVEVLDGSEKPYEVILNSARSGLVCLLFGSKRIDVSKISTGMFFQPGAIEVHQETTSSDIIAQENFFNLDNFKCDMCGEMLLLKLPYDTQRAALHKIPWRRRWFVLHGDYLWHTNSRASGKVVECIPLADNTVHKTTGSSMARYAFEIRTSNHIHILRAKTEEETSKWYDAIRLKIQLSTENSLIAVAEYMIADAERTHCRKST